MYHTPLKVAFFLFSLYYLFVLYFIFVLFTLTCLCVSWRRFTFLPLERLIIREKKCLSFLLDFFRCTFSFHIYCIYCYSTSTSQVVEWNLFHLKEKEEKIEKKKNYNTNDSQREHFVNRSNERIANVLNLFLSPFSFLFVLLSFTFFLLSSWIISLKQKVYWMWIQLVTDFSTLPKYNSLKVQKERRRRRKKKSKWNYNLTTFFHLFYFTFAHWVKRICRLRVCMCVFCEEWERREKSTNEIFNYWICNKRAKGLANRVIYSVFFCFTWTRECTSVHTLNSSCSEKKKRRT